MKICLGRMWPRAGRDAEWLVGPDVGRSSWRLLMIDATGWYAFANLTSRALAQACTEVDHTSRREVVSMAQYPDVALDDPGARCCLG